MPPSSSRFLLGFFATPRWRLCPRALVAVFATYPRSTLLRATVDLSRDCSRSMKLASLMWRCPYLQTIYAGSVSYAALAPLLAVAIALVRSLLCALVALCASCPRYVLLRATLDFSRDCSQPGVVFSVCATCPRSILLRAVMYRPFAIARNLPPAPV